jgi:hypothetical protein
MNRNYDVAKEVTHRSSVIARSEATKQSALAVWEIATGLRPRNDSRILCQLNNSEMNYAPVRGAVRGDSTYLSHGNAIESELVCVLCDLRGEQ